MTQPWAYIVAALLTGTFALTGLGVGLKTGRRQVVDQAAVEHEQWLRGQRQAAYVELLAAWDQLLRDFTETPEAFMLAHITTPGPAGEEAARCLTIEHLYGLTAALQEKLERVQLLGPDSGEALAVEMRQAMEDVREEQVAAIPGMDPSVLAQVDGDKAWQDVYRLRGEFFVMARDVMRTAPAPVVTRSWLRRRAVDR